ncbi:PREDICTED: polygalacturonase inhibitor-like [Nelumbo nucifera]|uniref:Polygalacturonase inhibitor-like n=2 Tax=Nelumbo nucifera TaxID=4432 RepID=A0A1U8AIV2_NELNU|nr:PREDICTED: polygalacturonase inhibitor-like [Nelumbo nucifera]DAD29908.1 TPA_asm: hypothetical protein HUJ06_031376 [Nelumbo nucifera]
MESRSSTSLVSSLLLSLLLVLPSLPSLTLSASSFRCNTHDYNTLLGIKKALNNPYDIIAWLPNVDCCDWPGITCDENTNRVTQFDISHSNLSAEIPPAVGNLTYLQYLTFHKNPGLHGSIPSTITKLVHLKFLRFSWDGLSGPIPEFLGQLKNLEYLNLDFNQFSGSIPDSLGYLPKLSALFLDRNKLSGPIPYSFGGFKTSDFYLILSHNQLSGEIPCSLGAVDLTKIDLSHNQLVGDASTLFVPNGNLQTIDLSRNKFDFVLSGVKFPKTLIYLDLSHNHIHGSIPKEIIKLELQTLNVTYNGLCGRIPYGKNMKRFDYDSFFHNPCLCGKPLPSCK